ncbi:hypothetical protein ACHQM5_009343 [Ranunculus cassubicifolius]
MRCNTLCFSPHSPILIRPPHTYSFKCQFLYKPSLVSCSTKNRVERWYNPKTTKRKSDQVEISRHWVEPNSPLPSISQEKFTVVSYNILGDKNAAKHRDLYSLIPQEYMKWDRRKKLICEELIEKDSDIICLQEVDKYYDLLEIMEKQGYTGSFTQRSGGAVDGCAMFWKADKFRLLEGESIEFKDFGLRDNVAQIYVFEMCRDDSRRVLVGNIHVLFNPSRGDIKLGQIRVLLSRAQTLSEKWGNVPVVLAGDFNCTPQSAIYQFISSSQLDVALYDKKYLSGQHGRHPPHSGCFRGYMSRTMLLMDRFMNKSWSEEETMSATGNTNGTIAEHPLRLKSSYASVKVTEGPLRTRDFHGEPLATSFHSKFLGTVDYLWYSEGLVPSRVLDTPPLDILRKTQGLPYKKLGSDHLALVSEYAFRL